MGPAVSKRLPSGLVARTRSRRTDEPLAVSKRQPGGIVAGTTRTRCKRQLGGLVIETQEKYRGRDKLGSDAPCTYHRRRPTAALNASLRVRDRTHDRPA